MTDAQKLNYGTNKSSWGEPMPLTQGRSRVRIWAEAPPVAGGGTEAAFLRELWLNSIPAPEEPSPSVELTTAPTWLAEVYSLVAKEDPDGAIDVLFERVDEMLSAGEFARCDDLLRAVDVKRLDTNLLVGALSITRRAAEQLGRRKWFVERVEKRLAELAPERVDRLLQGLR